MFSRLTNRSGTYALILLAENVTELTVGKLGEFQFEAGYYVYVGSAFGPGGLRARLTHHSRISNNPHWHLDYLKPATQIETIWYTTDLQPREHQWAATLSSYRNAAIPSRGFGATDCSCETHLIFFTTHPSGHYFRTKIREQDPGHGIVHWYTPQQGSRT